MKPLVFALSAVLLSCSAPAPIDGGIDAGMDAGRAVRDAGLVTDGGEMAAEGGCWGAGGRKFILQMKADGLCYFVSFRRPDAGIPTRYPVVTAPEDFSVDDARVGLCVSEIERADGQLDPQAPQPADFAATISWNVFLSGVPHTYNAGGTLDFSGRRYWFETPPEGAGITDPCRGP